MGCGRGSRVGRNRLGRSLCGVSSSHYKVHEFATLIPILLGRSLSLRGVPVVVVRRRGRESELSRSSLFCNIWNHSH